MDKVNLVIVICVCLMLGFAIGFYAGAELVIRKVVSIGQNFVDIDYELVDAAIYQYENQFAQFQNAPIHVD